MYSEKFQKSLAAVEAARDKNVALEPVRMTAQQKTDLLAAYHPDYRQDQFDELKIGPNKGDKVPKELAEILQAHSRICADCVDLKNPDYDVDVLVIGGGGREHAVIKAIKAATVPSKPTFATGGIVPGTSWSGDRVYARLDSGEMVINRKDQQRLWDLVSGGVPFAGIDYRLLAAAVAEGVEALPAPILDYSEFTRFRRRVEQVEKIAKLTM